MRFCPFKFANQKFSDLDDRIRPSSWNCEKHKCELWTQMYTTELNQVEGCALRFMARKNSEGQIVV